MDHLLAGVDRIVASGKIDVLALASNTAHIAHAAIEDKYPRLPVIHIADSTAAALKANGIARVGLLGTKPTMTQACVPFCQAVMAKSCAKSASAACCC